MVLPSAPRNLACQKGEVLAAPRQQAMANFVEVYLTSTGEAEMAFATSARRNQEKFIGWRSTKHGRELLEKGLA
jgi:hypothetical protein